MEFLEASMSPRDSRASLILQCRQKVIEINFRLLQDLRERRQLLRPTLA